MNWRDGTLFPDLEGYPGVAGFTDSLEQRAHESAMRKWWAAWERDHPPDRTCPHCGRPGGTEFITADGVGPRPWHTACRQERFPR